VLQRKWFIAPPDRTGLNQTSQFWWIGLSSRCNPVSNYALRVRVWGLDGQVSAWSRPKCWKPVLLQPADWSARFVTPAWRGGYFPPGTLLPICGREFELRPGVKSGPCILPALVSMGRARPIVGDRMPRRGWTDGCMAAVAQQQCPDAFL